MLQYLSNTPVLHHGELPYHLLTCYEVCSFSCLPIYDPHFRSHSLPSFFFLSKSVVVGILKKANWYQYGFGRPQGPIPGKSVSGADVREFANFILSRASLPQIRNLRTEDIEGKKLCVFSRTQNRLILNEDDMTGLSLFSFSFFFLLPFFFLHVFLTISLVESQSTLPLSST